MNAEQMILDRLDSIEGMLRKLMNPLPPVALTENDFTRAKRAALDAREKSQQRRELRQAAQA
ncbi:MAG: hypothetical protein WCI45_00150 [Desulfuromonadales bacterium]